MHQALLSTPLPAPIPEEHCAPPRERSCEPRVPSTLLPTRPTHGGVVEDIDEEDLLPLSDAPDGWPSSQPEEHGAPDSFMHVMQRHAELPRPEEPSPPQQASPVAGLPAERQAAILRQSMLPATLATVAGIADVAGWQRYVEDHCASCCKTQDPIERLLIEQVLLTHVRLTEVQAHAASTRSFEGMRALNVAAARLLGEFRKLALALLRYREGLAAGSAHPTKTRHPTGRSEDGQGKD